VVPPTPGFEYGWPSGGTTESDVAFQFLFDESNTQIVDEIASITCAESGTPTYSQSVSGLYSSLSPGIQYTEAEYHEKNTPTTEADLDTTNGNVIEAWVKTDVDQNTGHTIIATKTNAAGEGWDFAVAEVASSNQYRFWAEASDTTAIVMTWTGGEAIKTADTTPSKVRLVLDWASSNEAELFINNLSQSTVSIGTLAGKTIGAQRVRIGRRGDNVRGLAGKLYEMRKSNNIVNDSGG